MKYIKYTNDLRVNESLSANHQVYSVTLDDCVSIFLREGLSVNCFKCNQLHVCFIRSFVCEKEHDTAPVS